MKDTPKRAPPITNAEVDESEENKGEEEGSYINEDGWLTRVLALRAPVDTRWNFLYYMTKRYKLAVQCVLFPMVLVYHAIVLLNRPPCTYVKGKLKYVFVIYIGSWLCCGP